MFGVFFPLTLPREVYKTKTLLIASIGLLASLITCQLVTVLFSYTASMFVFFSIQYFSVELKKEKKAT